MAPLKRTLDDDLIFTLSDHDSTQDTDLDPEDSRALHDDDQLHTGSKKRKGGNHSDMARPIKKQLVSPKVSRQDSLRGDSVSEGEDGKQDGAFNSEFEFEVRTLHSRVAEDFDGWHLSELKAARESQKFGNKKGVDIDSIIQRRQLSSSEIRNIPNSIKDRLNEDAAGSNGEHDYDDDSQAYSSLDGDDELLAEDSFGMGATLTCSEPDGRDADSKSSETNVSMDDHGEGSDDNQSIASPTAHPDDKTIDFESGSGNGDKAEEQRQQAFFAPKEDDPATDLGHEDMGQSFHNFSLSRPILKGIGAEGFSMPTPIQSKTIPVALLGKDVVGGAVTGSGKTAAFIVPILERLLYRPRKVPTSRVAILMPTRELAVQCFNVATKLASFTDITFCQLVGGFSLREQQNILKKRPDVVIATPGRFIDHMRNSASFAVDSLEILVLDEADRMLEDGFADELNEILSAIPKSRQTMLFSATMTDSVDKLIRLGLNRPVRLLLDTNKQTVGTLVQEFVRLRPGRETKRLAYLLLLCKSVYTDKVIIFFRQKREAHRVRVIFGLSGMGAAELHGSMSQEQRISNVEKFRSGKASYLLATDVASRGLDIKGIETVLNYEAPQTREIYLHRVGRTARAGRAGRACTIAAEPDRKVVKAIVKLARAQGAKIVSRTVDSNEVDKWAEKINDLEDEVKAVLEEEKEERQLAQAEMQVTRGNNLIEHHGEIMSRPKRTWFESKKDKLRARKASLIELNGPDAKGKKKKAKLSGKDKKRLDSHRDRVEGKAWKKKTNAKVASRHRHEKSRNSKIGRR